MKKLTVKDLTAEEKLRLLCSEGFWHTHSLGGKLPQVTVSDGPVGVRKPEYDEKGVWKRDVPSIAYPAIQMLANTWNRDCARKMGESLADDCIDSEVDVLLARARISSAIRSTGATSSIFRKIRILRVRSPMST